MEIEVHVSPALSHNLPSGHSDVSQENIHKILMCSQGVTGMCKAVHMKVLKTFCVLSS